MSEYDTGKTVVYELVVTTLLIGVRNQYISGSRTYLRLRSRNVYVFRDEMPHRFERLTDRSTVSSQSQPFDSGRPDDLIFLLKYGSSVRFFFYKCIYHIKRTYGTYWEVS
jgi:hypothetical protein